MPRSPRSPERDRANARLYYAAHREEIKVRKLAYYYARSAGKTKRQVRPARSREEVLANKAAYDRVYRAANQERHRSANHSWYLRRKDLCLAKRRRRRARLAAAEGSFTASEWNRLLASFDFCCGYCGKGDVALEADHRTPLTRGGTDYISNIIPACLHCNHSKYTKTEAEFRALRKDITHD